MKTSPSKSNQLAHKKFKYLVTIEDTEYITWAYTEENARSNVAYRYADENDEDIGLVIWKIKEGDLYCEVIEIE